MQIRFYQQNEHLPSKHNDFILTIEERDGQGYVTDRMFVLAKSLSSAQAKATYLLAHSFPVLLTVQQQKGSGKDAYLVKHRL